MCLTLGVIVVEGGKEAARHGPWPPSQKDSLVRAASDAGARMADPIVLSGANSYFLLDLLALFLTAARRFNCACRIFSLDSVLSRRFFFGAPAGCIVFAGRPGPRLVGAETSVKSALAFCSRNISASISETMSSSKMPPSPLVLSDRDASFPAFDSGSY